MKPHLQTLVDRGVITVDASGPTGPVVRLTRKAWQDATRGTGYEEKATCEASSYASPHVFDGVRSLSATQAARLVENYNRTHVPCLHFVGFKDDRWHNAVAVWGKPDFIHRFWDRRAVADIAPGDVVVFAGSQELVEYSFDDSANW